MHYFEAKFPILSCGSQTLASNLDICINKGGILGLIGPNGCGKSLMLDSICGLIKMRFSCIFLNNERIDRLSKLERWQRGIRRLYQQPSLPNTVAVIEAIKHYQSASDNCLKLDVAKLADCFEIDLNKRVEELSYGQRRLVEIISISQSGNIYLLDEPFAGISSSLFPLINEIILKLKKHSSILLVDHSQKRLESLADQIIEWPNTQKTSKTNSAAAVPSKLTLEPYTCVKKNVQWSVDQIYSHASPFIDKFKINLNPGEILYLIGPNGSGKSTILRAIAGVSQPEAISCKGINTTFDATQIHFSPQPPKLISAITVHDNFDLMLPKGCATYSKRWETVTRLMEIARLNRQLLDKRADKLSGGELALMALIGAAASRKSILILDEPFEGVSYAMHYFISSLILSLLKEEVIIIATAHSVMFNFEGMQLFDLSVNK